MHGPLFLTPVFQERIWGGTALRDRFGYAIPSERTGECWGISAHPHGSTRIRNGPLQGQTLAEVWQTHPELFGGGGSEAFPLLVKILDANEDLSVQVHPDDAYAELHESGERGKSECWYILDCRPDAQLILGHRASSRGELAAMIRDGRWEELLIRRSIRPGDFFYVPSGTVHALGRGTLVLEIQQSSDTTYRVYDYDRPDATGKRRELHVEQALDVMTVPHEESQMAASRRVVVEQPGCKVTCLLEAPFFTVHHAHVQGVYQGRQESGFHLATVMDGEGTLSTQEGNWVLRRGDHLIIPAPMKQFQVSGNVEMLLARPTAI